MCQSTQRSLFGPQRRVPACALVNAGATVVALHDKPESEGTLCRASSAFARDVDTALAILRDRSAGLLRLECFKSHYA
jgi:hypothetical protein